MSKTLHYVFDPLCGWCYGASATVSAVSRQPGIQLRLLPSGLFSGQGARSMDEGFASYAWANDQRIASLNVEQARAQFQVRRAAQYPAVGLAANASRAPGLASSATLKRMKLSAESEGLKTLPGASTTPWGKAACASAVELTPSGIRHQR
mgnify:CR=1 FL=1